MLPLAIVFLGFALISALFGFGAVATASTSIAQALFFFFIAAFVLALILSLFRRV